MPLFCCGLVVGANVLRETKRRADGTIFKIGWFCKKVMGEQKKQPAAKY